MKEDKTAGAPGTPVDKKRLLVRLFFSMMLLSAFTFGGGYVIISMMRKKFVNEYHWIDEKEMLDIIAIAQSAPGPIAINGAIAVGWKLAGYPGIVTAVAATVIPPFAIMIPCAIFYNLLRANVYIGWLLDGMKIGVGALIAAVTLEMMGGLFKEGDKARSVVILTAAFVLNYILNVSVIWIVLACILYGIAVVAWGRRKAGGGGV